MSACIHPHKLTVQLDHPLTSSDNSAKPLQGGHVLRRGFADAHFSATTGLGSTDLAPTSLFSTHSSRKGTTSEQTHDRHRNPSADIHDGFHAVRNVGSGNAAELATYVVEKGKALLAPA